MDDDFISIEPGDRFEVAEDEDGYPAVRIQNTAFEEAPRWIRIGPLVSDQRRRVRELIYTLQEIEAADVKETQ